MKCPHCAVDFHDKAKQILVNEDADGSWGLEIMDCSACKKTILYLLSGEPTYSISRGTGQSFAGFHHVNYRRLIRPKSIGRAACPVEVPASLAADYEEACLVLADSPKASAALSRRCLQHLLREAAKVKKGNLADEIQEVMDSGKLPSDLHDSIDAIRNIGNFAAHPMKSQATGEIVDVEDGEAEWTLDVLEALFDFYFVRPARIQQKKDALNAKLKAIGKPAMK